MIQEYLFMGKDQRNKVENFIPEAVERSFFDIENTNNWIARYSVLGENENVAQILSKINEYVLENFEVTVLTDESSAYYNQILFPYINAFERKLRKFLYLAAQSTDQREGVLDTIKDLEKKDLGIIFTCLFTDENYNKEVRAFLKKTTWNFTKNEMISKLNSLEENVIWNVLHKEGIINLPKDYIFIKDYRNDVMHAHDINTESFNNAKNLFEKINKQLDIEINKILDKAYDFNNFNRLLEAKLIYLKLIEDKENFNSVTYDSEIEFEYKIQ